MRAASDHAPFHATFWALVCSPALVARGLSSLSDSVVTRPMPLNPLSARRWWLPGHDDLDRGYPVKFNDLPVSINAHRQELFASHDWEPVCDGSPRSRVIFYDIWDEHRGLDDRVYAITTWLSFAAEAEAAFVFPDPNSSFSDGHGHASAKWWDDYYTWSPPVFKYGEAKCAYGAQAINITKWKDLGTWPTKARRALLDKSQPLCVRLQKGRDTQDAVGVSMHNMVVHGAEKVSVWTSRKVARVVTRVFEEVPELKNAFNAAHVRLGDKAKRGGVLCNNASFVVDRMERCRTRFGEAADATWILMSDGDEIFYRNMSMVSKAHGFKLVTEKSVAALRELEDNFLRYTALSCIWGASDIGIASYKSLGHFCQMRQGHSSGMMFLPCKTDELKIEQRKLERERRQ